MKLTQSEIRKKSWITRRLNGNVIPWNKTICPDVPKLKKLYLIDGFGSWKIAKEFNVSQKLALRWIKENNITIRNLSEASKLTLNGFKDGKNHPNWVGDKVSYPALHTWVRNHKGTPQKCEHCGTIEPHRYEWASIDHKYERNLNNWIRLCPSCHRKMDNVKKKLTNIPK